MAGYLWYVFMKITRVWAMPNKWTFTIKPIKELIQKYVGDGNGWIDPFAGMNSPAEITNDLNPEIKANYNTDAISFLGLFDSESKQGCLFDPPYSVRQVKECYNHIGINVTQEDTQMSFYSNAKDKIAKIIKPGGIVICCGWSSMGLGKNRGFEIIEILLVPHGGHHNDTIVVVEKKIQNTLMGTNK